jgi:hyperosmotically inducible protein
MKQTSLHRMLVAAALSSALAFAGCASNSRSPVAYVDDAVITTKVKAKFADDTTVSARAISVETINGTVLLRGVAKNAEEKAEAEKIARGVEGVRAVSNRIDIRAG